MPICKPKPKNQHDDRNSPSETLAIKEQTIEKIMKLKGPGVWVVGNFNPGFVRSSGVSGQDDTLSSIWSR
jgi:hypothetical protein